jgi:glycosyltransferase involved in cell wall biosynthesis
VNIPTRPAVLISHPAKQGNIYERPFAAQQGGWDVTFLTGFYSKSGGAVANTVRHLPVRFRERMGTWLNKRRHDGLDESRVVSIGSPYLEAVSRTLGLKYHTWARAHDLLASRWLARRPAPSIVHCFDGSALRTIGRAKAMGCTTVCEVTLPFTHQRLVDDERQRMGLERVAEPLPWWVRRQAAEWKAADFLIAQSHMTVDTACDLGIEPGRVALIPLGVDTAYFRPDTSKRGKKFIALFVGQIGIRKGVHWLLEAWRRAELADAELLLAGPGDDSDDAQKLLSPAVSSVRYLGRVDDDRLLALYQSAHVLVLPSIAEGGSNVLHEALACGLPVIISNRVGCVVEHGREGLVTTAGDVDEIVEGLRLLYSDESRLRTMSQAARNTAEGLDWTQYAKRLSRFYDHVLANGDASSTLIDLRPASSAPGPCGADDPSTEDEVTRVRRA